MANDGRRRPMCAACLKPSRLCICSRLPSPPLDNAVGVTVLQHSAEARHPLNSTRIARLGLANLSVVPVSDVLLAAKFIVRPLDEDGSLMDARVLQKCEGGEEIGRKREEKTRLDSSANRCYANGVGKADCHSNMIHCCNKDGEDGTVGSIIDRCVVDVETCSANVMHDSNSISDRACLGKEERVEELFAGSAENSIDQSTDVRCEDSVDFCCLENSNSHCSDVVRNDTQQQKKLDAVSQASDSDDYFANLENAWDCIASDLDQSNPECSSGTSKSDSIREIAGSKSNGESGHVVNYAKYFFSGDVEHYEVKNGDKCEVAYSDTDIRIMIQRGVKPKLNWLLRTRVGQAAMLRGVSVKKIQLKQCKLSGKIEEVEEYDITLPPRTALLYPAQRSVALETHNGRIAHLVVLDATWGKAQRMYHENPWLRLLPHLKLDSNNESLYHEVRHEPKVGFLSTVESIVCALQRLGDDREELDRILDVFQSMINDQRRCKEEKFAQLSQP